MLLTADVKLTQKQSRAGMSVGQAGADALTNAPGQSAVSGDKGAGQATGVSLRIGIGIGIGIGASSATSTTSKATTHDETAYGSRILSNGDVTIAATGGDLNVIGSQINGNNVALAAANNINLLSQAEQHTDGSTNKNGSGEIGFSVGSQTGWYVTASAGKGKATGNGTTHAESMVNANDSETGTVIVGPFFRRSGKVSPQPALLR